MSYTVSPRCATHILFLIVSVFLGGNRARADHPLIFPIPQELRRTGHDFRLTGGVRVLVSDEPTESDRRLAKALVRELSDCYGVALETESASHLRSATVAGRNPLLLSGLVLSGANLPPETDRLGLPTVKSNYSSMNLSRSKTHLKNWSYPHH